MGFFIIMLWTGMKVGEIVGLRWEDIDLEDGMIYVNHTLVYYDKGESVGCGYAINTPKTKAGQRSIPMLSKVKAAFNMEQNYQKQAGLSCNSVVDGYTNFIFLNRFDGVQNQNTLNRALKRIINDCNQEILNIDENAKVLLPAFSNHVLRHSFTTRLCEAGVHIKAIQDILGHSDPETTLKIYAEATKEMKKAEMISFEKFFADLTKAQVA